MPRAIFGGARVEIGAARRRQVGKVPFCLICFLQELSAFEVERDEQGPCCRQDGVPLARAGPRVVSDDAEPVPGGGTYGTLYEIPSFKYCGALFGQTHPKRHQCCHRSAYILVVVHFVAGALRRDVCVLSKHFDWRRQTLASKYRCRSRLAARRCHTCAG